MTRKTTRATTNDGTTVHDMPLMCSLTVTPPTRLGTRIVVSDSGDILSPMYAPEMIGAGGDRRRHAEDRRHPDEGHAERAGCGPRAARDHADHARRSMATAA